MNKRNIKIVGIASVSGGGKTTLVKKLTEVIPKSKALYFDDYDFEGPDSITQWVKDGSDYNAWNLSPLINDIDEIVCDSTQEIDYIFLDYPFARKHDKVATYIHHTIFIDTPLDIALARRIVRDFSEMDTVEIIKDVEHYISYGRMGYEEMLKSIKPNSDLIIEGNQPLDKIVEEVKSIFMI